jgi:type VI secretion system protein ImpJ
MSALALPALHASHSGCWLRDARESGIGGTRPIGKGEAIMAAADTPLLMLNAPLVASRLGYPDLARSESRIEAMIGRVVALEFEQRYFTGSSAAMLSVAMDPKWLQSDWQCYIGVLRGDVPEAECHRLLTGNADLDWKLGSADEVDRLFRMGLPGLELFPLERPPRALPARVGWSYYRIGTENPAYKAVQLSQSLAIRLRDSSVANSRTLAGQRRVDVASGERPGALEFAVFAVPN